MFKEVIADSVCEQARRSSQVSSRLRGVCTKGRLCRAPRLNSSAVTIIPRTSAAIFSSIAGTLALQLTTRQIDVEITVVVGTFLNPKLL